MMKIAITGNIAGGKSLVERYLIAKGYKVIDTDDIGHTLLKEDKDTILRIKEAFNSYDIYNTDGSISREKLGSIVFSDNLMKKELEKIMHSSIMRKVESFFEINLNENLVFATVPLLFEAGFDVCFDKIIFVSALEQIRLQRLIKRNNYTLEYAKKRIMSQDDEENKIKKSDFVIYNNSDLKNLENQIEQILLQLN